MRPSTALLLVWLLSACAALACGAESAPIEAVAAARPAAWAEPLAIAGLPNLHRVTATLYRGAQPTAAGMRQLETMGIKTILSLRGFDDDDEELAGTALSSERIRFKSWHPEAEDVTRFLAIVSDPAKQPVFVHCQHGADRTGMMCAIFRIVDQGWSKDDAVREMVEGGYGFHPVWTNLVAYVRGLDVPALTRSPSTSASSSP